MGPVDAGPLHASAVAEGCGATGCCKAEGFRWQNPVEPNTAAKTEAVNHDAFDEILGYGLKLESRLSLTQTMAILPQMKALTAPAKSAAKRRVSKWIPGGVPDAAISKNEANRFTNGLLKIADRIEGLPPDFAKNHKPYLHSLPKP